MESEGKKIIKKSIKSPKWIIIGYLICVIAIIGAIFLIGYRKENETPEPIDFTTDGALGLDIDKYAFFNVQGLTDEVAIYGDVENKYSDTNDRYYIALNEGYMYILDLDFDTIELLKPWQDYTFSQEENRVKPEPIKVYGMTESIPEQLKTLILDYYNEGLNEEQQISLEEFEIYFGSVLLNVRKEPVDTSIEQLIIFLAGFSIIVLLIVHLVLAVQKMAVKRYIKKNNYEEELENQLDFFVEEKYYKDKVILTRDFFIDLKYGGFAAFKYADVKWVHIHNIKSYGVTTASNLIVYLRDGKTKIICLKINGKVTDEFLGIFNKICEKVPADCLKGFTNENRKAFKEYKKELKRNR